MFIERENERLVDGFMLLNRGFAWTKHKIDGALGSGVKHGKMVEKVWLGQGFCGCHWL